MAQFFTSDTLISDVKRRAQLPSTQSTFEDADFLALANEEIKSAIVPNVIAVNEEYFVYGDEDVALTASVSNYTIPYRAIGSKLRDLYYEDTAGNLNEMTRVPPEHRSYYQNGSMNSGFVAFYVQGNDIILLPEVGSSPVGNLVFVYYLRPNELVASSRVATLTAINTTTGVLTMSAVPNNITVGSYIDLLQGKPGHKTRAFDVIVTAANATTVTVAAASLPNGLVVGDIIATAGECNIPQIPTELHPILSERVAARCLEAMGDAVGLKAANEKVAEMENKSQVLIDNRVESAPLKVSNSRGLLGGSRLRRRGL